MATVVVSECRQGWHDVRLIADARAGRAAALDALIEKMQCIPRILRARNRRAGSPLSPDDLDDLAQDVFADVWSRLDAFHGRCPLQHWVYKFCIYAQSNHLKRRSWRMRMQTSPLDHEPLEDDSPPRLAPTDGLLVWCELSRLPADEQELIDMKLFQDEPFARLAARESISVNTLKSRYYRALEKLRRALAPSLGPDA